MLRVLMIGAGRDVRGGVSSVVNGYYAGGLDKKCALTYLPTMEDGSKLKKLLVAARARLCFERLIKENDILHVHMSSDNSFYRKAVFIRKAYKEHKKILIHMHGSTFDLFYKERCNARQKRQVREIFAMADKVIALSEDWKRFLADFICDKDKIRVIYNAVPVPQRENPDYCGQKDYQNRKLLFLGILGQRKGVYDLIELLPDVFEKYPDAHIYFGGDGERARAEALCKEKGIENNVTFLGWIRDSEKEKRFEECSIYVLPTYHEGMPMSVLEAMSYGMAVISTYAGGIPHMIEDGVDGFLCKAGDREMMKARLLELLGDPEKKKLLGEKARDRIRKEFDITVSLKKLLAVYDEL